MSFLGLVGNMAAIKYHDLTTRSAKPVHTPTPLGLHQGTAVQISPAAPIVLSARGGILPSFQGAQSVTAVGQMEMFGLRTFRSYLSDGVSFIETIADRTDPAKASQCRLYTSYKEMEPGDDGWNDLLNDADGRIGLFQFDLYRSDANPNPADIVPYPRMWFGGGGNRVEPLIVQETITAADGSAVLVEHRLMQYGRTLGTERDAPSEFLWAEAIIVRGARPEDERASFNLSIGMDLAAPNLTVFQS
jgi:hypothetical protein